MPREYDNARGENHGRARNTDVQVARAKRMLIEAEHTSVIAKGEIARVAAATSIAEVTMHAIAQGKRWQHLPPAPPTATDNT